MKKKKGANLSDLNVDICLAMWSLCLCERVYPTCNLGYGPPLVTLTNNCCNTLKSQGIKKKKNSN